MNDIQLPPNPERTPHERWTGHLQRVTSMSLEYLSPTSGENMYLHSESLEILKHLLEPSDPKTIFVLEGGGLGCEVVCIDIPAGHLGAAEAGAIEYIELDAADCLVVVLGSKHCEVGVPTRDLELVVDSWQDLHIQWRAVLVPPSLGSGEGCPGPPSALHMAAV